NQMCNPDGYQSAWLTRYFYLNGFSNRLSSGTQSKLTEDIRIIDKLVAGRTANFDESVFVSPEDIRGVSFRFGNAYCKSILCLLSAKRPLDLRNAADIILQNRALRKANSRHFHHIFPQAYMRGKRGAEEINSIVNIALIPSDLNIKIGAKAPSRYLAEFKSNNSRWNQTLASHVISGAARARLEGDDFVPFLKHRATLLSKLAKKAVKLP
ncbi:hypothetical protein ACFLT7_06500, partial [candidate division KSB1 bacterium]